MSAIRKPVSVLFYNTYTSLRERPAQENTRVNITNTTRQFGRPPCMSSSLRGPVAVADTFICLTRNQTGEFHDLLMRTPALGHIVAVAVTSGAGP
jgi:hypothetical protein